MKPKLVILLQVITSAIGPAIALAQSPSDRDSAAAVAAIERALVAAIARAEPSVVAISRSAGSNFTADSEDAGRNLFQDLRGNGSAGSTGLITGAGVVIDPAGLVLTHYLAVREGDRHAVTTIDGKTHDAVIRAADPRSALAVLAIQSSGPSQPGGDSQPALRRPASFQAIRLGDAQKLRKGQFVVAIGNPFAIQSDGQSTASWGIVTNLARKAAANTNFNDAPGPNGDYRTTLHHLGTLIQTDAKLGWSAAGAALVNMQGELVGITTTAATIAGHEQPAGYAIPINATFRRIIDVLKEGREVEYGMLGITFDNFPGEPGRGQHRAAMGELRPVTVGDVFPGMPAARAGLQTGDIVTRVAGQVVRDIDSMQLVVSTLPPSTPTTIDYQRGGRAATTKATVAKLAVTGKTIATNRPDSWRGIRVDYATALEGPALVEAIASGAFDPQGCVLVSDVEPESDAWRAGIRPGMFISHVGRKRVSTPEEFRAATPDVGNELDIRLTRPVDELSADSDAAGAD
ncbi:MAG TPA: trypsin-like peptidase domain-containing protein [Lacipirellulaceae bacterium]|nr:trypsin-like peptidase domain-containing protein [Lacipirellulaceae bacterium]